MEKIYSFCESFFKLSKHDTNIKTELFAGLTTFVTMSYIIFVNPNMMADAGIPKEAALAATIITSALTCLIMGLWANMPVALAPGMGINAFFAYTVCIGMGLPWQTALGAVFISGVVFLILTITKLRQLIIASMPPCLRSAITCGIGLFIAFVGLKSSGIVVANQATLVGLGNILSPHSLLVLFGLIVSGTLMVLRFKSAILLGILITAIVGMLCGQTPTPSSFSELFSLTPPSLSQTFFKLDILAALRYGLFSVLFTLTVVDLFETIGTIIGLSRRAGMIDADGKIQNLDKALTVDSIGTILSSFFGTSSVTSYVESAAGIASGGRTGLTAVTTGILFLLCLFFTPFIGFVPAFATAPALILVGCYMIAEIKHINFDDMADGIPAFLGILCMPLTFNITTGFALSFISYILLRVFSGRFREINLTMWIIGICLAINLSIR